MARNQGSSRKCGESLIETTERVNELNFTETMAELAKIGFKLLKIQQIHLFIFPLTMSGLNRLDIPNLFPN